MSTELAVYQTASLEDRFKYARSIASAGDLLPRGLWANVRNPETNMMESRPSAGKVMLLTETGLMLGLHPMAALRGIDVIEGNPTLKPALMSALIRKAGHTLRIEQKGTLAGGDLAVTVTGIRADDPEFPYVYTWTPSDAVRAGLLDSYELDGARGWVAKARDSKGNAKPWEKYTARMCRWRALGDVASAGFEDILMGLHFTPEEFGAEVNDAGELVPSVDIAPAAEASADWEAQLRAAETVDDLKATWHRIPAAQQTDTLNTIMLTRGGQLRREEAVAPATPADDGAEPPIGPSADPAPTVTAEPDVVEAELVDEETPEPAEPSQEDWELEEAAKFAAWQAAQRGESA